MLQTPVFTHDDIQTAIDEYFEVNTEELNDNRLSYQEIISITAELLNDYVNGNEEASRYAVRYFVGCGIELNNKDDHLKRAMLMLKQLNEAYNQLASICDLNGNH